MAEDGALVIALDLQLAIMRQDFSALERRVLDAIMRYTYAAGKTKAEITAEDIRLMIEGDKRVRTDRIDAVLVKLTEQSVLTCQAWNDGQLIGIQRDSTRWGGQSVHASYENININNKYISRSGADKLSIPASAALVAYSEQRSGFKHLPTTWRVENSWAGKLLRKVLALTNDPVLARQLIEDYIEENEWMRLNVQRQFAYMFSRFDQWYRQIPRKPRDIQENQEALGKRYRYDTKLKNWIVAGRVTPQEV